MPSGESPGVEAAPGTPPLVIVCDRDNPDDAGVGDAGGAAAKDPSTPPAGCAKAVKATPPKKKRKIFEKKLDEYPEEAETTLGSHDGPPKRRLKEKTSPESLSPPLRQASRQRQRLWCEGPRLPPSKILCFQVGRSVSRLTRAKNEEEIWFTCVSKLFWSHFAPFLTLFCKRTHAREEPQDFGVTEGFLDRYRLLIKRSSSAGRIQIQQSVTTSGEGVGKRGRGIVRVCVCV